MNPAAHAASGSRRPGSFDPDPGAANPSKKPMSKVPNHVKAKITKDFKRSLWSKQRLQINPDWKISRFDQLNWQILHQNRHHGFYGSILGALMALPGKALSEATKTSLEALQEAQQGILKDIRQALTNPIVKESNQ